MKTVTIDDFKKSTIFVCVTKKFDEGENGVSWGQVSSEDWARGCWLVDDTKANRCEVLVAIVRGEIIGMWDIDESFPWTRATSKELPKRKLPPEDKRRKLCRVVPNSSSRYTKFIGAKIVCPNNESFMHGPVRYKF